MDSQKRTKKQLIDELMSMRRQIADLEKERQEHKLAAELLRQHCEEQQVIFDVVPAMIFYKDTENRFIRVNRALAEASGMTVEQMEGNSLFGLFPDLADKYWRDDKEVMAAGVPKRNIIEPMTTPDGVIWVKTDKIPFRNDRGDIIGIIGFAIDITALRNTENALREKSVFLQTLIDTIPNPIFYKNVRGEYTGFNNAFATYLGIEKEKILGKTVYDLSPKGLADVFKKKDQELFDSPGAQVYEAQVRYADGTLHDVIFNKATLTDEYGNMSGLVGIMLDVTDRKQAEEAIKKYSVDLRERVKELTCLYSVSEIVRRDDIPKEKILQECAFAVSQAYFFPEISACRIMWGDREHSTENFRKTRWSQDRAIMISGEQVGIIEVCYLEERQEKFEGPFLAEERKLLNSVAELIGRSAERKKAWEERDRLIVELRDALSQVKTLSGLLNTCSYCKRIRNDKGGWEQMEVYIRNRSEADFSHGICPECMAKLFPEHCDKK